MNTSYRVTSPAGQLLGIYPKAELAAVKALVAQHPGANVKAVVTIDNPCAAHPAFEADYCPTCGTAQSF